MSNTANTGYLLPSTFLKCIVHSFRIPLPSAPRCDCCRYQVLFSSPQEEADISFLSSIQSMERNCHIFEKNPSYSEYFSCFVRVSVLLCFIVPELRLFISVHALCQALLTVNLLTPTGKSINLCKKIIPLKTCNLTI